MITEDQLEHLCLDWFRETGYEVRHGPDISLGGTAPERTDYAQTILSGRLRDALQRLNPGIPASALEDAVDQITKPKHPSLIQNNRTFHGMLIEGVPVEYEQTGEQRGDRVKLIDFEHPAENRFLAVNQYTIQGTKQLRRPDVVVFVNGLPLFVLELKNPADEQADIWDAFNQLQTYKEEIADLFTCNEALVISDGLNARIGSLTADRERFMVWRTLKSEKDRPHLDYQLETLVRGFFDPELLLDYLRHFILFEEDSGSLIKKIAGYHQFHAVREAVAAVIAASRPNGDRRGGVVWHTQGSGKSISMACFAGKLLQQPEMQNPTLVVVTDRNDLDGQLYQTFCSAKALLKQDPEQAEEREELRALLSNRPSGGIIFTTIQKFGLKQGETRHPVLCERSNIVVISDEAHRSQYGLKASYDSKSDRYKYGYAYHLREALPNASFIGFTGTPIELEDKDTRAVFGEYVSIYDITDAVEDGATVPIYYESRLAKLDLNEAELPHIDEDVEEIVEAEETDAGRERVKSQWAALEKLVGSEPRLKQIAEDLVEHFENRRAAIDGKGIIVCMSRDICVQLYDELIELRPEWHSPDIDKGAVKIIMTGSASDKQLLQPHIYSKQQKKRLEKRFKDPNDPLKLVIVRDMWLTGFDAPCAHTMYVDKPMKGHNLMQAIARVNRVFRDKPGGLVVDYIGIAAELRKALKTYAENNGKGTPTVDTREALAKLLELMDVARALFAGFDYSAYRTEPATILVPAVNHILGLEDGKKRYFDVVLGITKAFSLCSTLDEAAELREEVAFFQAVKAAIAKATKPDKKITEHEKNAALKQILDNAVVAQGVEDIFALAGLDKPDIGILSDEFLEEVAQLPQRNLAVELLERLLNDEIQSRSRTNVVQEKKYSERLKETLNKYRNRSIETAQVIEELIAMAKEFKEAAKRGDELGLNADEMAFYDALANNESAVRELGDETLKKIAMVITQKLRGSVSVDWQVRQSVRAKLRNLVRVTLRRYKYPPDKQPEAIELVLKQAEVLSEKWAG